MFGGLTLLELGILATMLAPTDAALGKAVVTNPVVPAKVRESLNVESGLNDGICVPVLFIFLALAVGEAGNGGTTRAQGRAAAETMPTVRRSSTDTARFGIRTRGGEKY